MELLVERVVVDQPLQLRYEGRVFPEIQPRLDQDSGGLQPEPAQAFDVLVRGKYPVLI